MAPLAAPNVRLARPTSVLAILVILGLLATSFAPGSPVSATSHPSAGGSIGDRMVQAAAASLADHQGPAALPYSGNGTSNWTLVSNGTSGSNLGWNSSLNNSGLPPPRQMPALAYDPVDGYVVMFGGGNINPVGQFSDTWTFYNGTWTQLYPSTSPDARRSAAMVWDAADGYILLFGGLDPGAYIGNSARFNDTWSFLHGSWTNLTAATMNASNTPSARWNAQMAYDPARGETILFGGCFDLACASATNDTWAYLGGTWTDLTGSIGTAPAVRGTATLVYYPPDEALLMYGGSNPNQTVRNDTWEFGSSGWTELSPATSPPSMGNYWFIYDNATGAAVLFGGSRYSVSPSMYALNETWSYSNGTWTNQTAGNPVAPPPLMGFQSGGAYNPVTGCGLLFGGGDNNDVTYSDTWEYGCDPTAISSGGTHSTGGSPKLGLTVTPTNGTSPLYFNATAWLESPAGTNLSGGYVLVISASESNQSAVWVNETLNWTGAVVTAGGVLATAGSYQVTATWFTVTTWGWVPQARDSVGLVVLAGTSSTGTSGGPWLSFAVSPGTGSGPLNVTGELAGGGGTSPYDLTVCELGPSTSGCTTVLYLSAWDGSSDAQAWALSESGLYTFRATLVDASQAASYANASVVVTAVTPAAPLAAQGTFAAPAATSASGASYGFVARITGGIAPYQIQWNFGDGAVGSSTAGATAFHTYTASGSYVATLTVTDARGTVATSSVGPLVVALPSSGAGLLAVSGSTLAVALAAVVGLASAAVVVLSVQRLARRREALNWARELEERLARDASDSAPR